LVALPVGGTARRAALAGLDIQMIDVADAAQGMAQSLRAGLKATPKDCAGMLVGLADMPDITSDDYCDIINAFRDDPNSNIQRAASQDGSAGNPVLLPAWALKDPSLFKGDAGARHLLRQYADKVRLVHLPEDHAITDLDTPQDWAAWRARL
jgi:CTP:molybdopterin cytidylyltransferase MocA